MNSVVVITPPDGDVVSLEEAKEHLRVDDDDSDDLIEALVKAATQHIDGPNGWLGRALINQTLELRLDAFPCNNEIILPYPPYAGTIGVTYVDADGETQTIASSVYRVIGGGAGLSRLALKWDQSWPSPRSQNEAIAVQYLAGYGAAGSDVPEPIRQAIKLYVGAWYENREQTVIGVPVASLPTNVAAEALLAPYRVWL